MKGTLIAIDGACRMPGTPECFAVGTCVVKDLETGEIIGHDALGEIESTGQRGEIMGMLLALEAAMSDNIKEPIYVVTDSEYVFNCVTKEWYKNWETKGWLTADGNEVKNKDLWTIFAEIIGKLSKEIVMYHIKGHVFPFGKVTAKKLIRSDNSLQALHQAVIDKFDKEFDRRIDNIRKACELFEENNLVPIEEDSKVLKEMIVSNVTVDVVAGSYADAIKDLD